MDGVDQKNWLLSAAGTKVSSLPNGPIDRLVTVTLGGEPAE
jgi:hypothetical protein